MANITDKCKLEAYKEAILLRRYLRTDLLKILKVYYYKVGVRYSVSNKTYSSLYDILFSEVEDKMLVKDLMLKVSKPYSASKQYYVNCRGYFNFNSYYRVKGHPQEYSALEYYLHNGSFSLIERIWKFILFNVNLDLKDL